MKPTHDQDCCKHTTGQQYTGQNMADRPQNQTASSEDTSSSTITGVDNTSSSTDDLGKRSPPRGSLFGPALKFQPYSSREHVAIDQAPSSGGLFGGFTSRPASSTGGLFGSKPRTQQPSSGRPFGTRASRLAASTGGLFGTSPRTEVPTSHGFNGDLKSSPGGPFARLASQRENPTGSLFETPQSSLPASGGLFGQQTQPSRPVYGVYSQDPHSQAYYQPSYSYTSYLQATYSHVPHPQALEFGYQSTDNIDRQCGSAKQSEVAVMEAEIASLKTDMADLRSKIEEVQTFAHTLARDYSGTDPDAEACDSGPHETNR